MFYPRSKHDLAVTQRQLQIYNKKSCGLCGLPGEWAPEEDLLDKVLCFTCAEEWRRYSNKYNLWRWVEVENWHEEFVLQFDRFLNYHRSMLRVLARATLEDADPCR